MVPGRVGVREFVHQRHRGSAGDDGGGVHLAQLHAPILGHQRGNDLQFADLRHRLGPGVRLDVADDHVHAALLEPVALHQHLVGFADPRAGTEVDLELALLLLVDEGKEIFGLAPGRLAKVQRRIVAHGARSNGSSVNREARL